MKYMEYYTLMIFYSTSNDDDDDDDSSEDSIHDNNDIVCSKIYKNVCDRKKSRLNLILID